MAGTARAVDVDAAATSATVLGRGPESAAAIEASEVVCCVCLGEVGGWVRGCWGVEGTVVMLLR